MNTIKPVEVMGLEDISDALKDVFEDEWDWRFGRRELSNNTAPPPRVVAVPMGGPILRGSTRSETARETYGNRNPSLVFHCWASDFRGCEEMARRICEAIHELYAGYYKLIAEDASGLGDDFNRAGELLALQVSFEIPILSTPSTTTKMVTLTIGGVSTNGST